MGNVDLKKIISRNISYIDHPFFTNNEKVDDFMSIDIDDGELEKAWRGIYVWLFTDDEKCKPKRYKGIYFLDNKTQKKMFLKYNYAKKKMYILSRSFEKSINKNSWIHKNEKGIIYWHDIEKNTRNSLIIYNLPYLREFVKKYSKTMPVLKDEFICEGHLILARCIDLFNVHKSLDVGFSAYMRRAFLTEFSRIISRYLKRNSFEKKLHNNIKVKKDKLFDSYEISELKDILDNNAANLTEKEQKILRTRFFEDCTLEEVGKKFGLSKQRIKQIEKKVLNKLRAIYKIN